MEISQHVLRELFDYRDDGNLIWKVRPNSHVAPGSIAGCPKSQGYYYVGYKGKHYLLHRLIYAWHTGDWPAVVDHRSRDHTDNRLENLRPLAISHNHINSDKTWSASGFKGVTYLKRKRRFEARIGFQGKGVKLGKFKTAEEAASAYLQAREALYPDAYQV